MNRFLLDLNTLLFMKPRTGWRLRPVDSRAARDEGLPIALKRLCRPARKTVIRSSSSPKNAYKLCHQIVKQPIKHRNFYAVEIRKTGFATNRGIWQSSWHGSEDR